MGFSPVPGSSCRLLASVAGTKSDPNFLGRPPLPQKTRPAAWVLSLSRFRDWLPSRHGRPARHLASGFMAPEWHEHASRYGAPQDDRACRTLPRLAGARRHRARATSTGWRAPDALARARRRHDAVLGKDQEGSLLPQPLRHAAMRSEEHTSELQSLTNLVCR